MQTSPGRRTRENEKTCREGNLKRKMSIEATLAFCTIRKENVEIEPHPSPCGFGSGIYYVCTPSRQGCPQQVQGCMKAMEDYDNTKPKLKTGG